MELLSHVISLVVAYVLAAAMLASLVVDTAFRGRVIAAGLALMWLWTGIAYHWLHFTAINNAAWAFGGLFVVQGLLFLLASARGMLSYDAQPPMVSRLLGWGLIAYATLLYPMLGQILGPGYRKHRCSESRHAQ